MKALPRPTGSWYTSPLPGMGIVRAVFLRAPWMLLMLGAPGIAARPLPTAAHVRHVEILSPPYTIDRIYKSMAGPQSLQLVQLWPSDPPELLWITSYRVEVVGADGTSPVSQEFMCHNNLDYDPATHSRLFGEPTTTTRLFTLSQGQFAAELPQGFGLPVMSNERLVLTTQVLNHNRKDINLQVRHKVTIDFIRDKELTGTIQPLFPAFGMVVALLDGKDGNFGTDQATDLQKHSSCLPGIQAPDIKAENQAIFGDGHGRKVTGHWVVKHGHEERHTLITSMMRLPYDTKIHFIGAHLHPFAHSLELRDLTAGKSLFRSRARGPAHGIGLSNVDTYSSREGIPVYKGHEYEVVSVYDNASETNQDAMATLFFYLEDKAFKKPALAD